jgi:hypothetical protein
MPNKELAYRVLDDIKNKRFNWDQGTWVGGRVLDSPAEENECGTSYCFAGRVAALSGRKQLYETRGIIQIKKTRDAVRKSSFFVALPGEEPDMVSRRSGYTAFYDTDASSMNQIPWDMRRTGRDERFYVVEDGKFVRYYGDAVHASGAARRDLGISPEEAHTLFAASNTLDHLIHTVDEIFH